MRPCWRIIQFSHSVGTFLKGEIQWNLGLLLVYSHIQHFPACNVPSSLKNENNMVSCVALRLQRTLLPAPGSGGPGHVSLCCCLAMFCMLSNSIGLSTCAGSSYFGNGGDVFCCSCGKQIFWLLPLQLLSFRKERNVRVWDRLPSFFLRRGWVFEDQQL